VPDLVHKTNLFPSQPCFIVICGMSVALDGRVRIEIENVRSKQINSCTGVWRPLQGCPILRMCKL